MWILTHEEDPVTTSTAPASGTAEDRRYSLDDVRGRAVIPIWSETGISAAALLSLSRSGAYEAARKGNLPVLRVGGKVLCPVPALRRLLGDLPEPAAGVQPGESTIPGHEAPNSNSHADADRAGNADQAGP